MTIRESYQALHKAKVQQQQEHPEGGAAREVYGTLTATKLNAKAGQNVHNHRSINSCEPATVLQEANGHQSKASIREKVAPRVKSAVSNVSDGGESKPETKQCPISNIDTKSVISQAPCMKSCKDLIPNTSKGRPPHVPRASPGTFTTAPVARKQADHESGSEVRPELGKSTPAPRLLLSTVVRLNPGLKDQKKLTVVEKYITELDGLTSRHADVEVLYLSHNSLRTLRGIQQFRKLRVLSANYNMLEDIKDLRFLAQGCPHLEVLSLEGNKLVGYPNYRAHTLMALPNLRMLDNVQVMEVERVSAKSSLKREDTLLNVMLGNWCIIHKMEHAVHLLKVHLELRVVTFGRSCIVHNTRPAKPLEFNVSKFLQLWDFERLLTNEEREVITDKIRAEVAEESYQTQSAKYAAQIKPPDSDGWEPYFSQVMMKQQQDVSGKLRSVEETANLVSEALAHLWTARVLQFSLPDACVSPEKKIWSEDRLKQNQETMMNEYSEKLEELLDAFSSNMYDSSRGGPEIPAGLLRQLLLLNPREPGLPRAVGLCPVRLPISLTDGARLPSWVTGESGDYNALVLPGCAHVVAQKRAAQHSQPPSASTIKPHKPGGGKAASTSLKRARARLAASTVRAGGCSVPVRSPRHPNFSKTPQGEVVGQNLPTPTKRASPPQPHPQHACVQAGDATWQAEADHTKHTSRILQDDNSVQSRNMLGSETMPPGVVQSGRRVTTHSYPGVSSECEHPTAMVGAGSGVIPQEILQLRKELERRISGEARLQSLNLQLRDRLEQYQKQNNENVERATLELTSLQADMQATLQQQNTMEDTLEMLACEKNILQEHLQDKEHQFWLELAVMEAKLAALVSEKTSLEQEYLRALEAVQNHESEVREAELLRVQADGYNRQLQILISEKRRSQEIERQASKVLLRRIFLMWDKACLASIYQKDRLATALALHEHHMAVITLRGWQTTVYRHVALRLLNTRCKKSHMARALSRWFHCFQEMKAINHSMAAAHEYRIRRLAQYAFSRWHYYTKESQLPEAQEAALSLAAIDFFQLSLQKKLLVLWHFWLEAHGRPKAINRARAMEHHETHIRSSALFEWWKVVSWKKDLNMRIIEVSEWCSSASLRRALVKWSKYHAHRLSVVSMKKKADALFIAARFITWQQVLEEQRADLVAHDRGKRLHDHILRFRTVRIWRCAVLHWRTHRAAEDMATDHHHHNSKARMMQRWREHVQDERECKQAGRVQRRSQLRTAMCKWGTYHESCMASRICLARALAFCFRNLQHRIQVLLQIWSRWVVYEKRLRRLYLIVARRTHHFSLVVCLDGWRRLAQVSLRLRIKSQASDLYQLHLNHEKVASRLTTLELENLQLVNRLHEVTAELARSQAAVQEKDHALDVAHRTVTETKITESALRGDIDLAENSASEHALELARLRATIAKKEEEVNVIQMQLAVERQTREEGLAALRSELGEKQTCLEVCEQALAETACRLQGSVDPDQERKMQSAFEINAALRMLAEEKDKRIVELQKLVEQQENVICDSFRKASASEEMLSHALNQKDGTIHSLQQRQRMLQVQLQEKNRMIKLALHERDHKAKQMRQLVHEVQLLSEREQLQVGQDWFTTVSSMGLADHQRESEVVPTSHTGTNDVIAGTMCVDDCDTSVPSQIECSSTNLGSPVSAQNHAMVCDLTMLKESTQSMDSVLENLNNSEQVGGSAWKADNDGLLTQQSASTPHQLIHEDRIEQTVTESLPDRASFLKATPSLGMDTYPQVACPTDSHYRCEKVQQRHSTIRPASSNMSISEEQVLLLQELEELSTSCTRPSASVVVPADCDLGVIGDSCVDESIRHDGSGVGTALQLGRSPHRRVDVDGKQESCHERSANVDHADHGYSATGVEGQCPLPAELGKPQPPRLSSQEADFAIPQQVTNLGSNAVVDRSISLHNEIQALQKRILERLKSPPPPPTRQSSQRTSQAQSSFNPDLVSAP